MTTQTSQGNLTPTVGEIVAADYRKAEVFKRFGIDFCCGGKISLEQASVEYKVNLEELNEALNAATQKPTFDTADFNNWELDSLINHILKYHHTYVSSSLPILEEFCSKVAKVHGHNHPEVIEIYKHYTAIANELRMHMHKEEAILFPYINQMIAAKKGDQEFLAPGFGSVRNPIKMMEDEHDSAGNAAKAITELSNNFTPPEDACQTYKALYFKLNEFVNDLYTHIHLENNILFPKSIELEDNLISN